MVKVQKLSALTTLINVSEEITAFTAQKAAILILVIMRTSDLTCRCFFWWYPLQTCVTLTLRVVRIEVSPYHLLPNVAIIMFCSVSLHVSVCLLYVCVAECGAVCLSREREETENADWVLGRQLLNPYHSWSSFVHIQCCKSLQFSATIVDNSCALFPFSNFSGNYSLVALKGRTLQSPTPRSSTALSWEGSEVTSGNTERCVVWMSRYWDRSYRKDASTMAGILRKYPEYSGFILAFLSVISMYIKCRIFEDRCWI
jgi:hypothetical protein